MVSGRLIVDPAARGSWNMAVDQALLEAARRDGQPTLRFYQWSPATLSLGYFQRIADRQLHPPSVQCDVVRRTTGGGAILHHHEWTYSLTLPAQNRWSSKHQQLVVAVHQALIAALAGRNVVAAFAKDQADFAGDLNQRQSGDPPSPTSFLCFQRRSAEDVVAAGWKILGSAQRRVEGALLQHGSFLLRRSEFAPEVAGVCDLLDEVTELHELADTWIRGIGEALRIEWGRGGLSSDELGATRDIEQTRFARGSWTERR